MNNATALLSLHNLEKWMKLDDIKVKVVRVRQTWEQERAGTVELLLEGSSLPITFEGQPFPIVQIEMSANGKTKITE